MSFSACPRAALKFQFGGESPLTMAGLLPGPSTNTIGRSARFDGAFKFQFAGAMARVSNNAVILSVAKRSRRIYALSALLSSIIVRRSFDYGLTPSAQDDNSGGSFCPTNGNLAHCSVSGHPPKGVGRGTG